MYFLPYSVLGGDADIFACRLRGYYTKYDCSAADVNPIGSISKIDLKRFIAWAGEAFNLPILAEYIGLRFSASFFPCAPFP